VCQIQLEEQDPEANPDQLEDGQDAGPDAETQEAAHLGEEVDPGHGGGGAELDHGRAPEVEQDGGHVVVVRVVLVVGLREDVAARNASSDSPDAVPSHLAHVGRDGAIRLGVFVEQH